MTAALPRSDASAFPPSVRRAAESLAAMRQRLLVQHTAGAPGVQTSYLASELCEQLVQSVWEAVVADLPPADRDRLARHAVLVAVGGFGRREMAPHSDIDLMLLHDREAAGPVVGAAKRLLQDLFDAGAEVGQSVRTIPEACRLAAADATILSSLLECRPLAGNADLAARLTARLGRMLERSSRRHALAIVAARLEERAKYGDSVALLEPNVKRSPGGLRDIQLVRWLGRVLHGESSPDTLMRAGRLSRADADTLREAQEFLTRLRNDLHLAAGKATDELTRDQQLRIAAARGIESRDGLLGVERFMRDYFRHTRGVAQVADGMVAGLKGPTKAGALVSGVLGHRVDGLFRVGPQDVAARPDARDRVAGSLDSVVRLVELAALYELPVEHASWDAVRTAAAAGRLGDEPAALERFLGLFSRPQGLGMALRRLHEVGALELLVPQFAHARNLLQFNNYHKYTVDEHCIVAVERAVALQTHPGWLGDVWRRLNRKRTVLLSLLVHDLGKGFVEDHSEIGAGIARDVAARFGLPADEGEIMEFLVLKHLAMAHQAFRRNTADDSLVAGFARDVGSPEVLGMLTVLTAADVTAVGPGVWTKWKEDLLGDLYFRTLGTLDGEDSSTESDRHRRAVDALLLAQHAPETMVRLARQLPGSYLRVTEPRRVVEELGAIMRLPEGGLFVGARWQPDTGTVAVTFAARESIASGVFHRLTAGLAVQRLEVLAANIHTLDDGLVLDHFVVHDPDYAGEPPADRLAEIAASIRAAVTADRPPAFPHRYNPFAPLPNPASTLPPRVRFDNESSAEATILEVFAHDSAGLLSALARTIYDEGLSVRSAKIGTYLDQVVDAFHVTDRDGRKVTDPVRLDRIRGALERVAAPVTGPARPSSGGGGNS